MDRKKELKEQYKQMKPEMGVYSFKSTATCRQFLGWSNDIKSRINRDKFQLGAGMLPNKKLQEEWDAYGESRFEISVIEVLEYDKDESKTDYTEDLKELLACVQEAHPDAETL